MLRKAAENRELKWDQIAKQIFHGKYTGSQCNQHWNRVLKDGIKKEPWTPNEDSKLYEAVTASEEVSWVDIKKQLPGRTDIQCRGVCLCLIKANNIAMADFDETISKWITSTTAKSTNVRTITHTGFIQGNGTILRCSCERTCSCTK